MCVCVCVHLCVYVSVCACLCVCACVHHALRTLAKLKGNGKHVKEYFYDDDKSAHLNMTTIDLSQRSMNTLGIRSYVIRTAHVSVLIGS